MIEAIASQKTKGWRRNLNKVIQEKALIPFTWGTNDCIMVMADSVLAMTGKDPCHWGRGKYKDGLGASQAVKNHYGTGFLDTFSRIFNEMGFIETGFFRAGDIGFVRIENLDKKAAAMFDGLTLVTGYSDFGAVVAPGKEGLVLIDRYELVRAWEL